MVKVQFHSCIKYEFAQEKYNLPKGKIWFRYTWIYISSPLSEQSTHSSIHKAIALSNTSPKVS